MTPSYVDAHAHLTDGRFAADLADVLARAAAAGVTRILSCGEDVASSERALALAGSEPIVRVAVGIHPHRAASCDAAALERLRALAADPRVVAIGEIGIDRSGRSAPLADQERAFAAQLALAAALDLPVVVHVRDAGDDARRIIDAVNDRLARDARTTGREATASHAAPRVRGQLHCYSEGPDEVAGWLARGFHLSFSGTVTYPKSDPLRAAARLVPADRLLAETDAPYLTPQAVRGKRNEPAFVAHTVAVLAAERGAEGDALAAQLAANAASLFGSRWG